LIGDFFAANLQSNRSAHVLHGKLVVLMKI
jgi:hypothetical protein